VRAKRGSLIWGIATSNWPASDVGFAAVLVMGIKYGGGPLKASISDFAALRSLLCV
jgi:hypothetical protein